MSMREIGKRIRFLFSARLGDGIMSMYCARAHPAAVCAAGITNQFYRRAGLVIRSEQVGDLALGVFGVKRLRNGEENEQFTNDV